MEQFTKTHFDFDKLPWLTNPRHQLHLEAVALGFIRLPKGQGYTFTHRHREQEEVYIVIEGTGAILLNGTLLDLKRGDAVRVPPTTSRALRASDTEDLLVICAGAVSAGFPHNPSARFLIDDGIPDYEDIPPWYAGQPEIQQKNAALKERMLLARARRNEAS